MSLTYRFAEGGREGYSEALVYYAITFDTDDTSDFRADVQRSLQARLRFPEISPVILVDEENGYEYRQLLVWKYYFFYRISDTELVIDDVVHEAAEKARLSDF